MGFHVFFSNPNLTAEAGFGRVAHFPCIFDARPGYHRLGNEYLIERGLGFWYPFGEIPSRERGAPTAQSLKNYAFWLANFLEWCEVRGIDLCHCSFTNDIQGNYYSEMLNGAWSRNGSSLTFSTANLRSNLACDFLFWMAHKGYRPKFVLPENKSQIRNSNIAGNQNEKSASSQANRKKEIPTKGKLRMPTDIKVANWLNLIYKNLGESEGLFCELILLSAMRREEVAAFRLNTIPESRADWDIPNPTAPYSEQQVSISIKYGTKGKCYGYDHGDKIGPEREIKIPLAIVDRLHAYRRNTRTAALKKWIKSATTLKEKQDRILNSVHLFLNQRSGRRITGKDIYSAWTSAPLPIGGWSPHQGRHWWACSILWREFEKHQKSHDSLSDDAPLNFTPFGLNVIRLVIKPQLGHSHENTTIIYLRWFADMVGSGLSLIYDSD